MKKAATRAASFFLPLPLVGESRGEGTTFLFHLGLGAQVFLVLGDFFLRQLLLDLRLHVVELGQLRRLGVAHVVHADDVVAELVFTGSCVISPLPSFFMASANSGT